MKILDMMAAHDDIVKKRLEYGPDNAKYTHHFPLIKVMADIILLHIRDEVLKANYFGIICDETKDLSHKELI